MLDVGGKVDASASVIDVVRTTHHLFHHSSRLSLGLEPYFFPLAHIWLSWYLRLPIQARPWITLAHVLGQIDMRLSRSSSNMPRYDNALSLPAFLTPDMNDVDLERAVMGGGLNFVTRLQDNVRARQAMLHQPFAWGGGYAYEI